MTAVDKSPDAELLVDGAVPHSPAPMMGAGISDWGMPRRIRDWFDRCLAVPAGNAVPDDASRGTED